jgi:hypothetical protein
LRYFSTYSLGFYIGSRKIRLRLFTTANIFNQSDFAIALIAEVMHHIDKIISNTALKRGDKQVFHLCKGEGQCFERVSCKENINFERWFSMLTEK